MTKKNKFVANNNQLLYGSGLFDHDDKPDSGKTVDVPKDAATKLVEDIVGKKFEEMDATQKAILGKMDELAKAALPEKPGDKLEDPPKDKSDGEPDCMKGFEAWIEKAESLSFKEGPQELSQTHLLNMKGYERGGYFAHSLRTGDHKLAESLFLTSPPDDKRPYNKEKCYQAYRNGIEGVSKGPFNMRTKDLISTAIATGGALIPPQFRQTMIDLVRNPQNIMSRCNVIPIDGYGNITLPTTIGTNTAYWTKESHIKIESQPEFGQLEWDQEKQTVFTEASLEMDRFSEPALGQILAFNMAKAATNHFNESFFYGLGPAIGGIRGINMDITDVFNIGAAFTWQDILGLEYELRQHFGTYGGFMPNWWYYRGTEQLIRLFVDGNGRPIWYRNENMHNFQNGIPASLDGYPAYVAPINEIPQNLAQTGTGSGNFGHIFFGDPINYWIFELMGSVMRFSDSHATNFQFNIRAYIWERIMAGRMLPRSFAKAEGVPANIVS